MKNIFLLRALVCGTVFSAGIIGAGIVSANPGMTGSSDRGFTAMDTDSNGKVSSKEFFAKHTTMKEEAFTSIDTNRDGDITADEWSAFFADHNRGNAEAHSATSEGMAPAGMPGSKPKSEATPASGAGSNVPPLIMPESE